MFSISYYGQLFVLSTRKRIMIESCPAKEKNTQHDDALVGLAQTRSLVTSGFNVAQISARSWGKITYYEGN